MRAAIDETSRRRAIQQKYNEDNNITPKSVEKAVRTVIEATKVAESKFKGKKPEELTAKEVRDYVKEMEAEMKRAADDLQFERAASLRDQIFEYKARI